MKVIQISLLLLLCACSPTGLTQSPYNPPERVLSSSNTSNFDPANGSTQYPGVAYSGSGSTAGGTSGNVDTGLEDTGNTTNPSLEMSAGHWTYTTGAETYNSCPAMDNSSSQPTDSAGFQVSTPTTGLIILTPDGSSDIINCQLEQNQYYCSPSSVDSSFSYEGFNVSIRTTTNLVIEPNSNTNAVFYYSLLFSCIDVQYVGCGVTSDLPCNVEFYANAVLD
jgi:hypothetical protein